MVWPCTCPEQCARWHSSSPPELHHSCQSEPRLQPSCDQQLSDSSASILRVSRQFITSRSSNPPSPRLPSRRDCALQVDCLFFAATKGLCITSRLPFLAGIELRRLHRHVRSHRSATVATNEPSHLLCRLLISRAPGLNDVLKFLIDDLLEMIHLLLQTCL
jgi:hypothetical protein